MVIELEFAFFRQSTFKVIFSEAKRVPSRQVRRVHLAIDDVHLLEVFADRSDEWNHDFHYGLDTRFLVRVVVRVRDSARRHSGDLRIRNPETTASVSQHRVRFA